MNTDANNPFTKLFDRYEPMTDDAADRVRAFVTMAADFVARSRKPLDTVTATTLKLNKISHDSIAALLKIQSSMLENTVDATTRHLNSAADAKSWQDFVDAQAALLPAERERFVRDVRAALEIFSEARDDVKDAFDTKPTVEKVVRQTRKTTRKTTAAARKTAKRGTRTAKRGASTAKRTAKKTASKARTAKRRTRKAA